MSLQRINIDLGAVMEIEDLPADLNLGRLLDVFRRVFKEDGKELMLKIYEQLPGGVTVKDCQLEMYWDLKDVDGGLTHDHEALKDLKKSLVKLNRLSEGFKDFVVKDKDAMTSSLDKDYEPGNASDPITVSSSESSAVSSLDSVSSSDVFDDSETD